MKKFLAGLLVMAGVLLCSTPVQAAVSCTNLTFSSAGSGSSKATASVSPTANHLIILWVHTSGAAAGQTLSASGNGLTWVEIGTFFYDTSNRRLTAFRAMGGSPSSGAITITASSSQSTWSWSVEDCSGIDTSGTNGSGAIVANTGSLTSNAGAEVGAGSASGLTVTLAALSSASNASMGWFNKSGSNVMTEGSGYASLSNSSGLRVSEYKSTGATAVNITYTSQSGQIVGGVALEIKSDAVAVTPKRGLLLGVK